MCIQYKGTILISMTIQFTDYLIYLLNRTLLIFFKHFDALELSVKFKNKIKVETGSLWIYKYITK